MTESNQIRVGRAMEALKTGLAPFVERKFAAQYGGQVRHVLRQVTTARITDWQRPFDSLDVQALLNVMDKCWNEVFRDILGRSERSLVVELLEVRNRWAHQEEFTNDATQRALDSASRLLTAIKAEPQAEKIRRLRSEVLRMFASVQPNAHKHSTGVTAATSQTIETVSRDRERSGRIAGIQDGSVLVVIVCAASKRDDAGAMRQANGKTVVFVAHPELMPDDARDADCMYARPDDISDSGVSWRQRLSEYNREYRRIGRNPYGLLPAFELYSHPIYRELVNACGPEHVFILSGGWGLIPAGYLTPHYDITFSTQAEKWKRRRKSDPFDDDCHIPEGFRGTIQLFGGKEYVKPFAELTQSIDCLKVVCYNSIAPPAAPGCELRKYQTSQRTNWYYQCARQFINGEIES